ncbi:MAG: hypothetical protein ACRBBK_03815 [Paracoccaceae bacterium]
MKLVALGGIALALAGCVDEGLDYETSYTDVEKEYLQRSADMDAQIARVNFRSNGATRYNTAWNEMPNSGSATYRGIAAVVIDLNPDGNLGNGDILAVGEGELRVAFGPNSTVEGSYSDFLGNNRSAEGVRYTGVLNVSGGHVNNTRPNDFVANADVRLTAENSSQSYEIHTQINGDFVGTPIYGVRAISQNATIAIIDDLYLREGGILITGEE